MSRSLKRNLCLIIAVISSAATAMCMFAGDWWGVTWFALATCSFAFLSGLNR